MKKGHDDDDRITVQPVERFVSTMIVKGGNIRDTEQDQEGSQEERDCNTCRHADVAPSEEPCRSCLRSCAEFKGFTRWEKQQ